MKVYQELATRFVAWLNCHAAQNGEWMARHEDVIQDLIDRYLPHGSGIDSEVRLDFERSKPDRLVFYSSYHVMNEDGYYDGWIDFTVVVTPSLAFGFDVKVLGKFGKHQDLKEYLGDIFYAALREELPL